MATDLKIDTQQPQCDNLYNGGTGFYGAGRHTGWMVLTD